MPWECVENPPMKRLLLILLILGVLGFAAAAAGIWLAGSGQPLTGPVVLTWRLDRALVDYEVTPSLPFFEEFRRPSLAGAYRALSGARDDNSVKGVAVYLQDARFGLAKAQELRRLLQDLAQHGKFVECYLETAGEGSNGTLDYYFATACDHISMAPAGDLNLLGLYANSMFVRGTLDKLKIEPDFTHAGEFKSAPEMYTHYEHSPEAEEALSAVLDDLYAQIVGAIAVERDLSGERVLDLIDGAPYAAAEAVELGLVDEIAFPDQFRDRVDGKSEKRLRRVDLFDYVPPERSAAGGFVAVVFAQGTIRRGSTGMDPWTDELFIGSDDLGGLLRDLAEDDSVDAVVLRVDSPGGSALASDLILREVSLLAEEKPVVVSMSDVAASGGYYISARTHQIVAEAATITGSIGVWAGKLVTAEFERELLGISHDTLKRGANADIYSSLQRFSPDQAERFQYLMDRVYENFVAHVAEGREMTTEEVLAVAAGRIWTGDQAASRGLVDAVGGLDVAIRLAQEAAGLDSAKAPRLRFYPRAPTFFESLFSQPRYFLPIRLEDALLRLAEQREGYLELPPHLAGLNRSF